ncbi:MAG: WHG domain-containing protein [Ruminiclostridium sp.]|nr:WHG domain-containing protein [Ruminiclostridium sp.]
MPPKARITKEMVIEAGLKIVRTEGAEALNVRRVAAGLKCSTQPIMYHYRTVGELKADVYAAADELHTEYILSAAGEKASMGLAYIRFAYEEKHLFRFLFQSGKFRNVNLHDLVYADELAPVIQAIGEQTGLPEDKAKEAFEMLFLCIHGAASMLANNEMEFEEEHYAKLIENTLTGIVCVLKGEGKK